MKIFHTIILTFLISCNSPFDSKKSNSNNKKYIFEYEIVLKDIAKNDFYYSTVKEVESKKLLFHSVSKNCEIDANCMNYVRKSAGGKFTLPIKFHKTNQKMLFTGHTNSIKNDIIVELYIFNKICTTKCVLLTGKNIKDVKGGRFAYNSIWFFPKIDSWGEKTHVLIRYVLDVENINGELKTISLVHKQVGVGNF